jgi:adenylate kinase
MTSPHAKIDLCMSDKLNKKILFLGPAGSGKGTQSTRLAQKYNLAHISTGDLIRAEIKSGSDLGNKVKSIVEAGQLVSDDIVNEIVKNNVSNLEGYILDGYPRTLEQAQFFDTVAKFDFVFDLDVPRELLNERLSGRRMCTKTNDANCSATFHMSFNPPKEEGKCDKCGSDLYQRKDDSEESIKKRLASYDEETGIPLNKFYGSLITKIDGNQMADKVFAELESKLLANSAAVQS